jgi:multidrug resistance efflux pump
MSWDRSWLREYLKCAALGMALTAVGFTGCDGAPNGKTATAAPAGAGAAADAGPAGPPLPAIPVKALRPRTDPNFRISVEQPAYVNAYYHADLMARVAGPVQAIIVDKGTRVKAGDALLTIDAPDLLESMYQREAVVRQRERELDLARASVKIAAAGVDSARSLVDVRKADVLQADAIESFRYKELQRFKGLVGGPSPGVNKEIYDEREQFYLSAKAASASARAAVEKAQSDFLESQAKLDAARADIDLKEALVAVARKDKDYAQAMLGFATIRAPFDGIITHRHVDPGSFVQNAATAQHASLLAIDRVDLVTVSMKVPDNYAPFVTLDTEATISFWALPGVRIRTKVSRLSGSLVNPDHDRTMPVEVDLFNSTADEYRAFAAKEKATGGADLKDRFIPPFPVVTGKLPPGNSLHLLPGLYGRMRLELSNLTNAYLVPSNAIFSAGGNSYLFLVHDGKAMRKRIEVQVDDGQLAKVAVIERVNGQDVRRELTGDETVAASNQGELTDGQAVKATLQSW